MDGDGPVETPVVIVDDPRGQERIFRAPAGTIRADRSEEVRDALSAIEDALGRGFYVAGYFSYELGYALEPRLLPLLPGGRAVPLLWFGVFERCGILRSETQAGFPRTHAGSLAFEWGSEEYGTVFEHVQALIRAGDLYQANISYRARFPFAGDAYAFYRALKARSGARHCAFVDDGRRQILSISPELFFSLDPNGRVKVRPMKGTAARGASPEADTRLVAELRASVKERAENLMIVDLLRNDLAKIATTGSVRVHSLFEVETYPTLHQMVSTVSAELARPRDVAGTVRALFPCGSVTGAPKIRAMEVIRELETSPRGVYCGSIGHFSPDGSADFNVAIRTLTVKDGRGELGIGSALVHDSRASAEFDECRLKSRFFTAVRKPLRLIETLRYSPSEGFIRDERHLARMERSAAALGISFDGERARLELEIAARNLSANARVRLLLDEDGTFWVETSPFPALDISWRYTISAARVNSGDPLLRHKTSRRTLYDREFGRATEMGCNEVLFLNEKDELTEGSRSNIFLERDGRLVTPHADCGLLDGCLRRELLDRGDCAEARLTVADLQSAGRVFLGNSLRGLVPATMAAIRVAPQDDEVRQC